MVEGLAPLAMIILFSWLRHLYLPVPPLLSSFLLDSPLLAGILHPHFRDPLSSGSLPSPVELEGQIDSSLKCP